MSFHKIVAAKYNTAFHDPKAPKWNEHKVEQILKSKSQLTLGEREELDRAIDYWEYINDISGEGDDDVLDNVEKELRRIVERMEYNEKKFQKKPSHLRLVGSHGFLTKVTSRYVVASCEDVGQSRRGIEKMLSRAEVCADFREPLVPWRVMRFP